MLICHSMGGLVARWCAEREDGHELVSRTITIGTPYKGAGMALEALANGVRLPRHIGLRFDGLVRSLPPFANCCRPMPACETGNGALKQLDQVDVLPADWVSAAWGFIGIWPRPCGPVTSKRTDMLDVFRGGCSPPSRRLRSVRLASSPSTSHRTEPWSGRDDRGDGTVPRDSATPPEWSNPALAKAVAQRHASMQLAASVQTEVERDPDRCPSADVPAGSRSGYALPSAVPAGMPFEVTVDGPSAWA